MNNNFWKYALVFFAGAVAGAVVVKNSSAIRSVCTGAIGGVMDLKDKAMETAEVFKESAEDLIAESDSKRKKGGAAKA